MPEYTVTLPDGRSIEVIADDPERAADEAQRQYISIKEETSLFGFAGNVVDSLTQGASFGWGDELTAAESALLGRKPGGGTFDLGDYGDKGFLGGWSDRYNAALNAERGQQKRFEADHPVVDAVAEIGGGIASGIAAPGAVAGRMAGLTGARTAAPTMASGIVQGLGRGAVAGGIYGAGNAEGDIPNTVFRAIEGAVTGGVVGGVMQPVTQAVSGLLRRVVAARPEIQAMRDQAGRVFTSLRRANEPMINPQRLRDRIAVDLQDETIERTTEPLIEQFTRRLDDLIPPNTPVTDYATINQLRKISTKGLNSNNATEVMLARQIRESIDGYVDDVLSHAGPALRGARDMWRRAANAERIETALYRATMRTSSSGTRGNIVNNMRGEIKNILLNPNRVKYFSLPDRRIMEGFTEGSRLENMLHFFGKLSPLSSTPAAVGNVLAAGQNPMALAGTAGAVTAKMASDRMGQRAMERMQRQVLGYRPPTGPANLQRSGQGVLDHLTGAAGGNIQSILDQLP
jgi:hypothetical protein